MSSNVVKKSEIRDLIVLPSNEENDIIQLKEPDWDAIAGVTGSPEGYPDEVIKLKPIHYKAMAILLRGGSQVEVANEVGVTKRTVNRWMTIGTEFYEIYLKRQFLLWEATNSENSQSLSQKRGQIIRTIGEF